MEGSGWGHEELAGETKRDQSGRKNGRMRFWKRKEEKMVKRQVFY